MTDENLLPDNLPDKLYFRIGEVAAIIGVEPHVLRYWEGEFNLSPLRSMSGQRLYRKQDISRFLQIQNLLHDKGFTVAGARKYLEGEEGPIETPAITPGVIKDAMNRLDDIRSKIQSLKIESGSLWE